MRRVTIASLAVAVSLAAPAAATASGGKWSKPAILVPTGTPTYQPAAAIGRDGTAVIVWEQYNTKSKTDKFSVVAAIRKPTGATKVKILGATTAPSLQPSLVAGGDGSFAVAWEQPGSGSRVYAAVRVMRPGAGFFGKTKLLSGGNVSARRGSGDFPQVAVDDAGTVYAVWEGSYKSSRGQHDQIVETQLSKGSSVWRSPVRLSPSGVDAYGAKVAANGAGYATIAWSQSGGTVQASIKGSTGSQFGAAQPLSTSSFSMTPPSVGVSDKGKTAVVWDGAGRGRGVQSVITNGGRFPGSGQYLNGKDAGEFQAATLASNGSGVVAWLGEIGGAFVVRAKSLSPSATAWSKGTSRISPVGYAALFGVEPAVAVDNKRAVVAWRQRNSKKQDSVGVRVRPAGAGWQAAKLYPAIGTAVTVAVPTDPVRGSRVLGTLVWTSVKGLQISILK
jgi:hypothetical protein